MIRGARNVAGSRGDGEKTFVRSIGFVSMLAMPVMAHAQNIAPEDEYRKLIKVSEDVKPLGDSPFGEQISLYDGTLSFENVDISVPGTGPTITVGRRFNFSGMGDRPDQQRKAFGDWDMDLPSISTVTANQRNVKGWLVDNPNHKAICSQLTGPPSVAKQPGDRRLADWEPGTWWYGYQLRIPGQATQELLYRRASNPAMPNMGVAFPLVTKQGWAVGCPGAAQNDPSTEGFMAVSPDGTKYFLNHLTYRYLPSLTRPLGSSPKARGGQDILLRREGRMLVTRIEDRFGNFINYAYGSNNPDDQLADKVVDIAASDGRHITIAYEEATRVSSVTVHGGAEGMRTWRYAYVPPTPEILTHRLGSVTQPDGSAWTYDLARFDRAWVDLRNAGGSCDAIGTPHNLNDAFTSTMTHPSGLAGSFTVKPVKRGRSYVGQNCEAGPAMRIVASDPGTWAKTPNASYAMSISERTLSGAGIGAQTWRYAYSPSNESWAKNCAGGCPSTVWTKVLYPDGHAERTTFSNRYDYTESLPLRHEIFDGEADVTGLRKATEYSYVNPDAAVDGRAASYVRPWGGAFSFRMNKAMLEQHAPLASTTVRIDGSGDLYTWNALAFDGFARATEVQRYSSLGYGVQERTTFHDDHTRWVLGLPAQTTNITTGEVVSQNTYDPNSATLSARFSFGRKVMGYAFDAAGQLAAFTNGNGSTTTLGGYKRGIPQSIGFPDGTSQSLSVDDFGQIRSVTNQANATTTYSYDAMGRIARIDYPLGMNARVFGYGISGDERGIAGAHWRRSVAQGGKIQMTSYDAMLRPILVDTYGSDGSAHTSSRTDYDWRGLTIFQSQPFAGAPAIGAMGWGTATGFDVIGRETNSAQASELGNLFTTTQYLSGGAKAVTDPRGNRTTFWYQAFDQPEYDRVVKVEAPENSVQSVVRDTYGKPLSITQGGAGQSVTKTMTYDPWHRLCRTWEPESGSAIMARDGADNVVWSASGASYNGSGCGYEQVADTSKTVRAYDAMNRVTSVVYPTGTAPSSFTYDALGNPATATSGLVGWTYGRNAIGQLTSEILSVDGWSWNFGYDYDANGALAATHYPDDEVVNHNPDALGRPTAAGGYVGGVSYSLDDDVASYAMGNGGLYVADKNARNLLARFTYGKDNVPLISEGLAYDANGNVTHVEDTAGGSQRSKSMRYDGLNRLLSASAPNLWGTESYTYDTLNNIRTLVNGNGIRAYNYDAANLLASISVGGSKLHEFRYDARGNTVAKNADNLVFDEANRLTSVGGKGEYTYDAAGRRVKRVTPAGTTYYAYNSAGKLMWEADATTRRGGGYVYLGNKLVARTTDNIDILRPSQVRTTLSIVGIPRLSTDGSTIEVVVDVANQGRRSLSARSEYPVQLGYHLVDQNGVSTQPEARIDLPEDIEVGAHAQVRMRVAAAAVLGTGARIRFGLAQSGVAWFEEWAGNVTVSAGPYSACPTPGTGNLCNNVTGLTSEQVGVAMAVTQEPTLSDDGKTVVTTVNVQNRGTVTLASADPHPVMFGAHIHHSFGVGTEEDVSRVAIPEIAPGTSASLQISIPSSSAFKSNRGVRLEFVQAELYRFSKLGVAPLDIGPFAQVTGDSYSKNGAFALRWNPIAGAVSYTLQESVNDGAWTTVQTGPGTSWSAVGRATGSYQYRVQACASAGCANHGGSWPVTVLLPPPTPAGASATAPIPGPVTLTWHASPTATSYVVDQQFNGAQWTRVYDAGATAAVFGTPTSGAYVYRVQACNSSGCSAFRQSNAVSITRPPSSAPPIHGSGTNHDGAYTIGWGGVAEATYYNVFENTNGVAWGHVGTTAGGAWGVSGKENGTYYYAAQACNAGGCGPWSGHAVVTVAHLPHVPSAFIDMVMTGGRKFASFTMRWSAAKYATSYQIARYPGEQIIYNTNGSSHWLEKVPKPFFAKHTYAIRGCNAVGCSPWSRQM